MRTETLLALLLVAVVPTAACLYGHDDDGDGFSFGDRWWDPDDDCDDSDPTVHPGAPEICDGRDNDCDGLVDEAGLRAYRDRDGDGLGGGEITYLCTLTLPDGVAFQSGDCDDRRRDVHPGAVETCDGRDNNCNGRADEGTTRTWWIDADDDGIGTGPAFDSCNVPERAARIDGDCDDSDPTIPAGGPDVCAPRPADTNCDGVIDCPLVDGEPIPIDDVGLPIGADGVAPPVPVALTDDPALVVFRARLDATTARAYTTFGRGPIGDPTALAETFQFEQDTVVVDALEWTDVDGDGWKDLAVIVEHADSHSVALLPGSAARGRGGVPTELVNSAGRAPRIVIGPMVDAEPVLVVRLPDGDVSVFGVSETTDAPVLLSSWELPLQAAIGASGGAEGRVLTLATEGDGDSVSSFALSDSADLGEPLGVRALWGGAHDRALSAGPLDETTSRAWMFSLRRVPAGIELSWMLDTLQGTPRDGTITLGDAGAGDPVAAWATGRTGGFAVVAGSADALYHGEWSGGRGIRLRPIGHPESVVLGRRVVRLEGVGPAGADGVFVSADGEGHGGWIVWAD